MIMVFTSYTLAAQEKIELTGQIKDGQSKEVLEFCSVSVFNSKDSLITGSVTDDKGFFALSLKRGSYYIVMNYIGYKIDTTPITGYTENKFIGVFRLQPDQHFLNEVSVTTSSHENLVDKDVQIVTEELRKGTSDAKGVLDKLNGVEYDRYNNSIKVDNDSKVIILVDGMQKDQDYIKNLPPERLKKIEVIRSPGGRYALEGYSAVINIILKKDYQGMELALFERAMLDPDAGKKQEIYAQNNIDATYTYVYNKINVYAKYNSNLNNFNLQTETKKQYDNGITIEKKIHNNDRNLIIKELENNYTIGADYYLNPKHTISFESNLTQKPLGYNTVNAAYDVIYNLSGSIINNFALSENTSDVKSTYNSVFYEGKLDENNILNSNFTYSTYSDKYSNNYFETSLPAIIQNGTDNKNSTKFYLEYLHTFKNKTSIQFGYGNTWEKLFNTYFFDTLQSEFNFTDTRHKLYSYYSWQKNKLSVKVGAAAETSLRNIDGQSKSYLILQPYTDVQYKPSQKINFKLKYRVGSNYPNISQINPFTTNIDFQSVQTGNPLLRPEVTHKISLQTNILSGLMSIEPYYHVSNNYIAKTGMLRGDSIFEYNFNNIGNYQHYGLQAHLTVPLGESFFLESDFGTSKSSISYSDRINKINNWVLSSQFIYQSKKNETVAVLKYQKNLVKHITAQGYDKGDNDFWIILVQQPFFKKRLSVMFLYFLPVNFGVDFNQGGYTKTDTYVETRSSDISFLKNMFIIELSFRFNKGKSVNKTDKQIEVGNEKNKSGVF
ncbi:MAG: outer membrane beta-barrel protein [Bacteroidota bacterium]